MNKTSACMVALVSLAAAWNACAAETSLETRSVHQHHVLDVGSADAVAVVAWLQQRKREGQVSEAFDPDSARLGALTVDIHTVTRGPIATRDASAMANPDTTGAGGVTLPTSGTPGETIMITNCTTGTGTVTETWTWTVASDGTGSWQLTDVTSHMNRNTRCAGGA